MGSLVAWSWWWQPLLVTMLLLLTPLLLCQSTLPPVRYPTRMSIFVTVSYVVNFAAFVAAVVVGAIFVAVNPQTQSHMRVRSAT